MRSLSHRGLPQLQGPNTTNPALSYPNLPVRSHYPHFAIHHDRPILIPSLNRRRRREKLSREGVMIAARWGGGVVGDLGLNLAV